MKFYISYCNGSRQGGCYSVVEADDYEKARKQVFEQIGPAFAFMYSGEEFTGQAEKYGLTEIPLQEWDYA